MPTYLYLCGITEKDIWTSLDSQMGEMAEANGISKDECYTKLKNTYDGYHFEADTVGIYNPYSLLNALSSKAFKDYWFETGTPSYLIEQLKRTNYPLTILGTEEITANVLGNIETIDQSPIPMLYQSGYLTLRGYDKEFEMYRLGFPSLEVERGFTRYLIPYYTRLKSDQGQLFVANFVKELRADKVEAFMQRLESLFADGDYQVVGDAELYFQNVVWVIFKMIGFYTEVERATSDGRIDMIVKTSDYIYIFEFKLDKTGQATASVNVTQEAGSNPQPPTPEKTLEISKNSVSFTATGGNDSFTIQSNTLWTVSSDKDWCTVSPTSGSNDGTVTVKANENTELTDRTATITVKADDMTKSITVTQAGVSENLQIDKTSLSFTSASGSDTFKITSNTSWTESSDQSWCTVSPISGSNDGTVTVSVKENTETSSRTATITVKFGDKNCTINITQNAFELFDMVLKEMFTRPLGTVYNALFSLNTYKEIKTKVEEEYVIKEGDDSFNVWESSNASLSNYVYQGLPFYYLYINKGDNKVKWVKYYFKIEKSKMSTSFSTLIKMVDDIRALGVKMTSKDEKGYTHSYVGEANGVNYYARLMEDDKYYTFEVSMWIK